jgi:hypothetical protein
MNWYKENNLRYTKIANSIFSTSIDFMISQAVSLKNKVDKKAKEKERKKRKKNETTLRNRRAAKRLLQKGKPKVSAKVPLKSQKKQSRIEKAFDAGKLTYIQQQSLRERLSIWSENQKSLKKDKADKAIEEQIKRECENNSK